MTIEEAKAKIKSLLMAEIDRLPSHYDIDIKEEVYSDIAEVNELLELNKIVCGALDKQIPKTPADNSEQEWFECPTCGRVVVIYHDGKRHHCRCGQSLKWEDKDDTTRILKAF